MDNTKSMTGDQVHHIITQKIPTNKGAAAKKAVTELHKKLAALDMNVNQIENLIALPDVWHRHHTLKTAYYSDLAKKFKFLIDTDINPRNKTAMKKRTKEKMAEYGQELLKKSDKQK